MAAMLDEVSTEEFDGGRGMLSVVVVHKYGDMEPGPGFFKLAESLGLKVALCKVRWIRAEDCSTLNILRWVACTDTP